MDGLLVIDKPAGPTSHDVVAALRRTLGERRVGHTGTLDPMASGVLPVVVGRATRLARFLSSGNKSYLATLKLGTSTDTCDAEGTPIGSTYAGPMPQREVIDRALGTFRGTFMQRPPAFSAKRIGGRRSHRLARARRRSQQMASFPPPDFRAARPASLQELPAPVSVTAHAIDIVDVDGASVTLRVDCSAGFYVRALAHDLGECLGTGAHLTGLRRTRSSGLTLEEAIPFEELDARQGGRERAQAGLVPLSRMLTSLPRVNLTEEGARRALHGGLLSAADVAAGFPCLGDSDDSEYYQLFDSSGNLLAIATASASPRLLHPAVVLM